MEERCSVSLFILDSFFPGNRKKMAGTLMRKASESFISIGKNVIESTESKQKVILTNLQRQEKEIMESCKRVETDLQKSIAEQNAQDAGLYQSEKNVLLTRLQEIRQKMIEITQESILKEATDSLQRKPSFLRCVYCLWTFLTTRYPFIEKFVQAIYSFCAVANIFRMYETSFFDGFFSKILMLLFLLVPRGNTFSKALQMFQTLYHAWVFLLAMCKSDYLIVKVCAMVILVLTMIHQIAGIKIVKKKVFNKEWK